MPAQLQQAQSFQFVKFAVFGMGHQLKVIRIIVQRVFIFMVRVFTLFELPSKFLLKNVPVFPDPSLSAFPYFYNVIGELSADVDSSTSNRSMICGNSFRVRFPRSSAVWGESGIPLKSFSRIHQRTQLSASTRTLPLFNFFESHMPTLSQAHVLCQV